MRSLGRQGDPAAVQVRPSALLVGPLGVIMTSQDLHCFFFFLCFIFFFPRLDEPYMSRYSCSFCQLLASFLGWIRLHIWVLKDNFVTVDEPLPSPLFIWRVRTERRRMKNRAWPWRLRIKGFVTFTFCFALKLYWHIWDLKEQTKFFFNVYNTDPWWQWLKRMLEETGKKTSIISNYFNLVVFKPAYFLN